MFAQQRSAAAVFLGTGSSSSGAAPAASPSSPEDDGGWTTEDELCYDKESDKMEERLLAGKGIDHVPYSEKNSSDST